MLVLFETPAGYALFKVLDTNKLKQVDNLHKEFATAESARNIIKLKAFDKFNNMTEALEATSAMVESKLTKSLTKFLKTNIVSKDVKDSLLVTDKTIGAAIKTKLGITCVADQPELLRCIRSQLCNLITGLSESDLNAMALGLSHSLSRYKLKFSPDKVDTMIVQAIGLLDDLDKEINTYAMRVREWYGWHFPELGKIVTENLAYCKTVKLLGIRTATARTDLSSILPEEIIPEVKTAAEISMGTEVSTEDIDSIKELCDQVIQLNEYREQLFEYLKNRMNAIAPNLTILIGELVGARLIAHAGSLLGLAKQPASTIQILGAEKALFRALKTRHSTPKYGLIYHASLIGQSAPKNKGKISRLLAAKAALLARVDALNEAKEPSTEIGVANREKVEVRLRQLEGKQVTHLVGQSKKIEAYDPKRSTADPSFLRKTPAYNTQADSTLDSKKRKREEPESNGNEMDEDEDEEEENEADEEEEEESEDEKPKKVEKVAAKQEEKKSGKKEEKKTPQKPKEESEDEDESEEDGEEESEEEERPKKKVKVEKSTPKKSEKEEKKDKKAKKEKEGKKKSEKEDKKAKKSKDKKEKKEKEGGKKKKSGK